MDLRNKYNRQDYGTIVVVIALMLVMLAMWLQASEPVEEDFTITIDCRAVIMNFEEFPSEVVDVCRNKVRFIREASSTSLTV